MGIEIGISSTMLSAMAAAAGAATAAGSAYMNYQNQQSAQKERDKQEDLRQEQVALEKKNKFRQVIRQAQSAQATGLVNATSAGAGFGSGIMGGSGAITSNAATDIGGIQTASNISSGLFASNAREGKYNSNIQTAQSIGQLGSQLFQNSGQIGQLFGSPQSNPQGPETQGYGNSWNAYSIV